MPGYWGRPEESERAIPGGALHTGDVGFMDADGWFYVVDRKKDQINAAGYKVWPREVEDVLYGHPAVREAAVVGVPDAYRGETVKAFVSLRPGEGVEADELIAFCRERMAAYKYPRVVEFVDELPRTASGKVLRRAAARPLGSPRVMPDVYVSIETADEAVQERLAEVLELRAAEPAQQAMLEDYLADLPLPDGARVLEVGCGTGAVARTRRRAPGVGEVVGLDPSPVFVEHARRLAEGVANLSYVVGSGTALAVRRRRVRRRHLPHRALAHPRRRGGAGRGGAGDRRGRRAGRLRRRLRDHHRRPRRPRSAAGVRRCRDGRARARSLPRAPPRHARARRRAGRSCACAATATSRTRSPGYILTLIDRGADTLVAAGASARPAADALKAEARRRVAAGEFFGHIAYASLIARRP